MIREKLRKHGIKPDSNRDQHFLDDSKVAERMVEEAEFEGEESILEIGAGIGNLTEKIAEKSEKVYAVEKDKKMVEVLQEELSGREDVETIHGDINKIELPEYDKCISNPPYHLSSEIVEKLGRKGKLSVLMLQKEFAERIVAEPGNSDYSRITVLTNLYFIPVFLENVPKDSFYPEPEVDSAIVKLYPRKDKFGIEDEEWFLKIIRGLFTHRNKKTRNAFVDARHIIEISKDEAKELRDKLPHSEERVKDLEMKKLGEISNFLRKRL
ncbi:MAG: 16S rRNA (adenine(1518)-N(6)/adenine(1519)-N(6))-dimethyltransferase RsmA [Candidatus Nanohaloarchaeota archaeon QJJ-9]|nr:16S rRNA (adenine(1518)-N(6)/adenine(1519)-N(6))-dimethyltransferase RsmA [Candidatus Nanohaloarchaeota archaeon QJJ-9]